MSYMQYFNLAIGAPRRLALMREAFATHATRYPYCPESVKPRNVFAIRGTNYKSAAAYGCVGLHQGFNGEGFGRVAVWYSHGGENFRDERDAKAINPRLGGYYTDVDGDATACGIVARLPHGRFIAGYAWSDNGERVYFPEIFTDEDEAARRADSHAERFADMARDDSYKAREAADMQDSIETSFARLRELFVLRNVPCMSYARAELVQVIGEIRNARETLRTEFAEYV